MVTKAPIRTEIVPRTNSGRIQDKLVTKAPIRMDSFPERIQDELERQIGHEGSNSSWIRSQNEFRTNRSQIHNEAYDSLEVVPRTNSGRIGAFVANLSPIRPEFVLGTTSGQVGQFGSNSSKGRIQNELEPSWPVWL